MKLFFFHFLFALFVLIGSLKAQVDSNVKVRTKSLKFDTNYIKSYYDYLCITAIGNHKSLELGIENTLNSDYDLQYKPNTSMSYGVGIDYKWFTAEFTSKIPFLDANSSRKGKTESFGAGLGITGRKFWFTSFLQSYNGMYLSNPEVIDQNWNTDQDYPYRSDLKTVAIFSSVNYAFNSKKYSQMAALWQLDRQLKSAGTFVIGYSLALYAMHADSSIMPGALIPFHPEESRIKASSSIYMGWNFGYAYNWIIKKKWIMHVSLIPRFVVQSQTSILQNDSTIQYDKKIRGASEGRFLFGKNTDRFYYGLGITFNVFSDQLDENAKLLYNFTYTRLFWGVRIDVDKRKKKRIH